MILECDGLGVAAILFGPWFLLVHKIKAWLDSYKKSNTCISVAVVLVCDDLVGRDDPLRSLVLIS
jgi:hypothetical protein